MARSAFGSYFEHYESKNGSGGAMYGVSTINCKLNKEDAANVKMK